MLLAEDHTPVGAVEACHLAIRTAYFEMPPTQLEKIATARTVGVPAEAALMAGERPAEFPGMWPIRNQLSCRQG
jgi:hypothetical protein